MSAQLPLHTKIAFGAGTISDGVKNTSFNTFLLFFYTQVVGLSGSAAGTVILLALIVDAVTDPLVGHISDHFQSRWGRRHPFMYAAALPMGVCFVLLFNPPADASTTMQFAWMLVFTIGVRVAMTFYAVPSSSLTAELTDDYDERTGLVSFRILAGWLGGLAAAQVGYLVFFAPSEAYPDGRLNAAAYGDYALLCGAVIIVAILICAIGTHRLIPQLHQPAPGQHFSFTQFFRELKQVFSNRAYLVLVLMILIVATATGFTDVMNLYVTTYYWEFSTDEIAVAVAAAAVATVLAFAVTPVLSRRSDKKTVMTWTMASITFIGPLPVTLRLFDLMPANDSALLLPIIVAYTGFIVFVAVVVMIVAGSMIADTIDLNERDYGVRQEGMFNAAWSLLSKATSGIGGFIAGVALDVIAFPARALPGEVDASTVDALGIAVGPGIFIFWVTALVILGFYPLTREKHHAVIEGLRARKLTAQEGAAALPPENTANPTTQNPQGS